VTTPGPAILEVERSGGFGGLTVRASVPLEELTPEQLAALEECYGRGPAPPAGPDRFVYRFRQGGREAEVQEDRVPADLAPLLDRLAGSWRRSS
jgi:hypothetical protein